jgi:hypothetical protein
MKPNELRIGSYVYFEDELLKFDFEMGWNFDYIKPIPLTEEWLLKLGFECILDISYSFPKPYDNLELSYYGSINGFKKGWVINKLFGLSNGIKYVHELQNLYFALTNEEL